MLDEDIKKLAIVMCLQQIIKNDGTMTTYFDTDLYSIINRYSENINRTFQDLKNKFQSAPMNTRGGVFGATGSGGIGSQDGNSDSYDSGPFVLSQMPQVAIANNDNNDLSSASFNSDVNNNNSPTGLNGQTIAANGNQTTAQISNVNNANVAQSAPNQQVPADDYLADIAKHTMARNGQNPEAIRVYVGTEPAANPVASRDRILDAAGIALRDLTWRCSHAYKAKFTDYMKIKASKDRHLIDSQIQKLKKFIDWLEGTKSSRGHGKHHKDGDQYDQTKLERKANDAGVVIIRQDNPGRKFNSASTTDMLRLKHHLLEKFKGKKCKNFDHIFEREFKKKFPNGDFTKTDGDNFVINLYKLFNNRNFYKRFDLGQLVSVNSTSGKNLIMLGPEAVNALENVDPARDGYLNYVIALENRDLLKKYFDNFNKTVKKNQNRRLTPYEICALASNGNIPIEFSVQGNSEVYHNNVKVFEEINNSLASSPAPGQRSPDLSITSYNLDSSTEDSDNSADLSNNRLNDSGSGEGSLRNSYSSLNSSTETFDQEKFLADMKARMTYLENLLP